MIKVYSIAALLLVLVPSSVFAQRAGDAALGAVAGAVVLGPVGAVAGAFVGYTAGPSSAGQAERSGRATSYPAPNPPRSGSKLPPVQTLD